MACLLGIGLSGSPGHAQMRGPRINDVRNVTCVANWERRFRLIVGILGDANGRDDEIHSSFETGRNLPQSSISSEQSFES